MASHENARPAPMILQAIITKHLGPTNTKGSRIKATAWAGSVTIPYSFRGMEAAHAEAAEALARKLGWSGHWFQGGMPAGDGASYAFVMVPLSTESAGGLPGEAFTVRCGGEG